jgi:NAD-dependent SIR2 family protein deacetylase
MPSQTPATAEDRCAELARFVERQRPLFVLTGAGVSTASGIPDYRDGEGNWKLRPPVQYQAFIHQAQARQRYWARSLLGWARLASAEPNPAHLALTRLERAGYLHQLVTQNVDGLHQRAGTRRVIDLHGRLDGVDCLGCRLRISRAKLQDTLLDLNPELRQRSAGAGPDGDARLDDYDWTTVKVPACTHCGGLLKPAVVMFGEDVPRARVERALLRLSEARGLLVVGSSLMVYSGYRFVRAALARSQPVAIVNLGRTRADQDPCLKLSEDCGSALARLAASYRA